MVQIFANSKQCSKIFSEEVLGTAGLLGLPGQLEGVEPPRWRRAGWQWWRSRQTLHAWSRGPGSCPGARTTQPECGPSTEQDNSVSFAKNKFLIWQCYNIRRNSPADSTRLINCKREGLFSPINLVCESIGEKLSFLIYFSHLIHCTAYFTKHSSGRYLRILKLILKKFFSFREFPWADSDF